MKKKFYRNLLLLIPLGLVASCGGENQSDEGTEIADIAFFSYKFDALAQLSDSLQVPVEGGEYCQVKGQGMLPRKIGDADVTSLLDSLCNLGQVILLDKGEAQPILEPGITLTDKNLADPTACSVSVNELSVDLLTPQLIVWKDYYYNFLCGAAHGMYSTSYVNYSIPLKKILGLDDIFREGYESELKELIKKKIASENIVLLVSPEEIEIPNDFRITTHSMEFVYGLYEIAPYSEGEVRVDIDRAEIENLMQPEMETTLFGGSFD